MNFLYELKYALMPEILLTILLTICCILCFLSKNQRTKLIHAVCSGGLLIVLLSLLMLPFKDSIVAVSASYISDAYSILFRILIVVGTFITLQFSKRYSELFGKSAGEFYTLILAAALGAMFLVGANDLILIFVALETLSISSFLLAGFSKSDKLSTEAALKYLVIGAASSAVLLYGFSFLYGITGQTNINQISEFLSKYQTNSVLILSFLLVTGGFCYKIAAVPFHTWSPDVYEGAPIPVAAFLSVVSKIAGFAVIIKILSIIYSNLPVWTTGIASIAVVTMTLGNFMAINQTNIKRLMAYSSIAHTGYILTGLVILTQNGTAGIIFYLITYLFMNFGAWSAIEIFINKTGKDSIKDLNGLIKSQPLLSIGLTLCLLSLAGIPFTAGFFGKFFLFSAIATANINNYFWLLLIALVNTVISVYYYLRIINAMILKPCEQEHVQDIIKPSLSLKAVFVSSVIITILLGFFASPVLSISKYSASKITFINSSKK